LLDATSAYNYDELVFWHGAKAYKFVAKVSKSFASGMSIHVDNAKACHSNGTCLLDIYVTNSSNSSWCIKSR